MANNKSKNSSKMSGPRIWSQLLLLVINCLSFAQNQEGPTKHNWIEITSPTQWPAPDPNSQSPFYLLHGEPDSNPQTLQLNPNLISSIPEIIQTPTLNFKYWTDNSNATFFFLKSTKPDKFQLETKGQWTQSQVRNLEPDSWNKLAFRVEDLSWTDYTVAFKDVTAAYIERLPISSLPPDPILSHHLTSTHSPNLSPVNITHNLLLDPNPQNPLLVYKNWALINLTTPITLPLNEANPNSPQTLLQFRFQALPDGVPQTVTLSLEQWEDSCQNDLALANAYIECTISHAPTSKTLTAFKLFLTGANTGFALWNPQPPENQAETSFFTETAPTERTRFKVSSPHSGPTYVALVDSQKPGTDWCYTVEPKNEANPPVPIHVYFTFDLGPSGTKLLTAKSPSTSFCLHEYLGLANLRNYQLTFMIPNGTKLQSNFQFDISKTETDPSVSFRVLGPKDQAKLKGNQWLLYDRYYNIRSKTSPPDPNIKFSFCDLTLNCFPFEPSSNTYFLPEYAQTKILPKTPYLRFQIDGLDASTNILDQFTFDYFNSTSNLPPNLAPIPQFEHNKPNCPTNFASNPDNPKSCIQRQFYKQTTVICEPESPGCSNIFSRRLVSSSKYRSSTQNALKQFIPYQPTQNTNPSQTSLEIKLPKVFPNSDICLHFAYTSARSPLFISANLNSKYHSAEYPIGTSSPNGTGFRACASWFSPNPIGSFFIRFTEQPLFDIDNHFVSLESRPFATQTMQSLTWRQGIYQNAETVSKFQQIFLPNSSPNFAIQSDGSIVFNLNLEALQASQKRSSISYLRSKWISQPKLNQDTVFLSLRIEGSDLYHEYLESSLIINSPSQTVLHTANLADLNPNILNTFKLSSPADQIQITLKIKVNLLAQINQKSLSFKIINLVVNDPCINADLGPSIDCANGGVCSREQYDNYLGTCKCSDPLAFRGPNCDQIDYCYLNNRAGLRRCGHLGGKSNSGQQICECRCPKGLKFDYTTQKCLPATVPACGENEIAVLKGSVYACVCLKGTITVDKRCVWYDPCNLKHRMALGQSLATCPQKESDCKATGTGPKDFECICKEGSFNELEIKTSSARCIPNDMKSCQQGYRQVNATNWECICNKGYHKDPTSYSCLPDATTDTSKCTPTSPTRGPKAFLGNDGTTCQCPPGFLFNLTVHTCDIDQALAANFGCSKLELKADDKPGCVCAKGQKFDESTRVCPLECDQEAAGACAASRQAQCRFDKAPICFCDPKSDIAFAESAIEAANWRCVSKCDWLLQRRDLEKARCNEEFQTCLPSQLALSCFSHLQDDKIFISNHSSLSFCPTSKYCQCETGFQSTPTGKCAIHIQNQVRFIRDLPFEAPPASLPRIQDAFIALIHALFAPAPDDKAFHDETGCKVAGKSTIKCTAAFRYEADNSVIQKRLEDNCHPIDEPTGSSKCTYASGSSSKRFQKRDTTVSTAGNALIRAIDAPLDVQTIDYCDKPDRCILHSNSFCNSTQPLLNVNSFNCLCKTEFYDILKPDLETDPTLATSSYQTMQACKPKDFCSKEHNSGRDYCVDKTARCHSLIEQTNGLYSPKRFCLCADSRLLAGPNISCSSSCSPDYCSHHGVCGQDASDVSHLVCNCDDGWTGAQCSDSVGQSYLPFLIATIVVSLISLSAVGAIVFIYFKRKPNLEEPLDFQIARRTAAAQSRLRRIHSDIIHKTSAQTSER